MAATLDDIRRTHQPFSTRHRIIDVQGRIHDVIVVAELLRDDGGEVIGTNGFYVDVTFPPEERESFISEAVADIAANRAVIAQVKGILMIVYRIEADAAFDLLTWRSQAANVKLRVLAEQLLADFRALNYDDTLRPSCSRRRLSSRQCHPECAWQGARQAEGRSGTPDACQW